MEEQHDRIQNLGEAAAQHAAHLATLQQKVDRIHQDQRDLGPPPQVRTSSPSCFPRNRAAKVRISEIAPNSPCGLTLWVRTSFPSSFLGLLWSLDFDKKIEFPVARSPEPASPVHRSTHSCCVHSDCSAMAHQFTSAARSRQALSER